MRSFVHSVYKAASEAVLPVKSKSSFKEDGKLTPEEFVRAGDYLVHTCPTWAWEGGDPKKAASFLPLGKQFLITRNVPCLRRAAAVEEYGARDEQEVEADEGGEGWVTASQAAPGAAPPGATTTNEDGFEEIPSVDDAAGGGGAGAGGAAAAGGSEGRAEGGQAEEEEGEEDVPDIADLELEDEEEDEAAARPAAASGAAASGSGGGAGSGEHILRTRTYDLLITYDKHYAVPRFWLIGYDENRQPLTPAQVLEDVSEEHARKTVTMEPHPHGGTGVQAASIHPCQHANVMHKLSERMAGEGADGFQVDRYLVLFLKFIASVVPTIEYDYTMAAGAQQ
ncbi:Autophagy-related 3 [Chlorella sorokiniana]|uniref:Autophagy-related 3 n=1 Tax=Chlorella sorokiniana TaxID=3076 RepID=A0A2P6TIM3_CHLSO|nr:Autophagy-related 3 [Chlorella sorokiniana]|eukprot:PRW39093.1 Autophagy-related 3 [Chlorella sorokiniana]